MLSKIKSTIALVGGRAFFVRLLAISKGKIMAKEITEITDRIVSVNRRGFLSKAAGVLAASTAVVVPIHLAQQSKREEMARALHEAVGQFNDDYCPSHVQVCNDGQSLNLAVETIRENSVEEIEIQLLPLFGGLT